MRQCGMRSMKLYLKLGQCTQQSINSLLSRSWYMSKQAHSRCRLHGVPTFKLEDVEVRLDIRKAVLEIN